MADSGFKLSLQVRPWREIVDEAEAGPQTAVNFTFSDGLAQIPIEDIIDVYNWVIIPTGLNPAVRMAVLPLWLHGYLYQRRDLAVAAFAPLAMPGVRFEWPLLDEWRDRADSLGVAPHAWPDCGENGRNKRLFPGVEMFRLLDLHIQRKITNRRDAASYYRGCLLDRRGWHLAAHDEGSATLLRDREILVDLSDWRTYPPFFPGDSTEITLNARC